jgi:hypothetical protein
VELVPSGERTDASGSARGRAPVARKALRIAAVSVAAVVALAGWGVYLTRSFARTSARKALQAALRGYEDCLIGPPLLRGETARARVQKVEAGLPEALGDAAAAHEAPWPLRCRADLDHAHAALALPAFRGDARAAALDALVARARVDVIPPDAPDLVDLLLVAGRAVAGDAATPARAMVTAHSAPPAASPIAAAALPPLPVPSGALPDEVPDVDATTLRVTFLDDAQHRWRCTFGSLHGETLREVRCSELGRAPVAVLRPGVTSASAYLRTQKGRFDRFELVRPVDGQDADVTWLPSSVVTVGLFADQLVWVTAHRMFARLVTTAHAPLGPEVDLGEITGKSPELEACPTPSALVVGVKTFDPSLAEHDAWRVMAAAEGGSWRRTPGRAVVDAGATLTCEGHAGTWAWAARRKLSLVQCNADRCEARASGAFTVPWDVGGKLHVADLGGEALVLGVGTSQAPLSGGSVTSLRMRIAPLAAIASAPDAVLFSDAAHDGAGITDALVYYRGDVAVVLVRGDGPFPYRAIRVDALGNYAPIALAN